LSAWHSGRLTGTSKPKRNKRHDNWGSRGLGKGDGDLSLFNVQLSLMDAPPARHLQKNKCVKRHRK